MIKTAVPLVKQSRDSRGKQAEVRNTSTHPCYRLWLVLFVDCRIVVLLLQVLRRNSSLPPTTQLPLIIK